MARNPPAAPSQPPQETPPSQDAARSTSELPESLAQLAGEADAGAAPSAETAAPDDPAPTAARIPTAEFLEGLLLPLAGVAPHLHHGFAVRPITPPEVKMLAVGWGAVLDEYFPGGVGQWGPWGAALGATVAVLGPRLMIPKPKPAAPAPGA